MNNEFCSPPFMSEEKGRNFGKGENLNFLITPINFLSSPFSVGKELSEYSKRVKSQKLKKYAKYELT